MTRKIIFQERQFSRSNPLTFLIWLIALFIWTIAFLQLIMGISIGDRPASDIVMLILWLTVGVLLPLFFLTSNLLVILTEEKLQINYIPFIKRSIPLSEIVHAEVRQSNALQEYGGWGIRFSRRWGRSYTIKGAEGIQLELRSGQKIFVGSTSAPHLIDLLNKQLSTLVPARSISSENEGDVTETMRHSPSHISIPRS